MRLALATEGRSRGVTDGLSPDLSAQPGGSADAGIAAFVETKQAIGRARDPNAHAFSNRAGRPRRGSQPQSTGRAKIHAIVTFVDAQSTGQPARASRQVAIACSPWISSSHELNSFHRLQRPQEYSCPNPRHFAANVDEPARAIRKMNVRMAAPQEKRPIARPQSAKRVPGGISGRIGFGFYDAAAHPAIGNLMHQSLADQKLRQLQCVDRQFAPLQPAHPLWPSGRGPLLAYGV
jgi:hypothetical protein